MKKLYKLIKDRNEEEKRTGKASYKTIIDRYFENIILCNNITEIDKDLFDNIELGTLTEYRDNEGNCYTQEQFENDTTGEICEEYKEIYQYYLTDFNCNSLEYLKELTEANNDNSIILAYSDKLDLYVLLVAHFGTGWDYVSTNIKLTENFEETM